MYAGKKKKGRKWHRRVSGWHFCLSGTEIKHYVCYVLNNSFLQGKFQEAAQLYKKCGKSEKVSKKKNMHWPGIEPGPPAWQARILPLNHQCWYGEGLLEGEVDLHILQAVDMYMDLRQFDLAKEFAVKSEKRDVKELIAQEADWAKNTNDSQAAW